MIIINFLSRCTKLKLVCVTKPLPVVGKFEAEIHSRVTIKSSVRQFGVVDECDGNLIGYETATYDDIQSWYSEKIIPQDSEEQELAI